MSGPESIVLDFILKYLPLFSLLDLQFGLHLGLDLTGVAERNQKWVRSL